jgi:hypothetical protein
MTKPITDKAEVALEYPDKLYVGTFERSSRFEAHLDPTGIALVLERPGADDVHCENSPQRLAAFRRMTSSIVINSRRQSLSCTRR